jgi:3-hydroxyacyl-[acyl-carrier-protein] dehydratase
MRFHLIDRIESWEADTRISARKVTSVHEDYWQQTPDGPALPFGMALESLCQAMTWLIMLSSDHQKRAALLSVREATLHRPIVPGDVLHLEATVVSQRAESALLDGSVSVDGVAVLEAQGIMCALIDGDRLEDPADTARMAHQLLGGGPVG